RRLHVGRGGAPEAVQRVLQGGRRLGGQPRQQHLQRLLGRALPRTEGGAGQGAAQDESHRGGKDRGTVEVRGRRRGRRRRQGQDQRGEEGPGQGRREEGSGPGQDDQGGPGQVAD